MTKAKLILITGFNASGKTTIAKKYIADHSLAMSIEADTLVDNIGNWANYREEVRRLTFTLTTAMIRAYLPSGHDVILPYIISDFKEIQIFESIARDCDADYYEVVLYNEKADAITRLLKRGRWGSVTSPRITDKDLSIIEKDFANMETILKQRPNMIRLTIKDNDPDTTYRQLLQAIGC